MTRHALQGFPFFRADAFPNTIPECCFVANELWLIRPCSYLGANCNSVFQHGSTCLKYTVNNAFRSLVSETQFRLFFHVRPRSILSVHRLPLRCSTVKGEKHAQGVSVCHGQPCASGPRQYHFTQRGKTKRVRMQDQRKEYTNTRAHHIQNKIVMTGHSFSLQTAHVKASRVTIATTHTKRLGTQSAGELSARATWCIACKKMTQTDLHSSPQQPKEHATSKKKKRKKLPGMTMVRHALLRVTGLPTVLTTKRRALPRGLAPRSNGQAMSVIPPVPGITGEQRPGLVDVCSSWGLQAPGRKMGWAFHPITSILSDQHTVWVGWAPDLQVASARKPVHKALHQPLHLASISCHVLLFLPRFTDKYRGLHAKPPLGTGVHDQSSNQHRSQANMSQRIHWVGLGEFL